VAVVVATRQERVNTSSGVGGHQDLARFVLDEHAVGLDHYAKTTERLILHHKEGHRHPR